jgi:hypothetical protein
MLRNHAARLIVVLLLAAVPLPGVGAGPGLVAPADPAPAMPAFEITTVEFAAPAGAAQPAVAADPGRGFILTWQQRGAAAAELWFAEFDRDGREQHRARIAAGAGWFVNWADFPALVVLDNGDWVTWWLERHGSSRPGAYDLKVVRSTDRGRHWSPPVTPHDDGTATQHGFVSAVPLGGDRVLLAWLDGRRAAAASAAPGADEHGHDDENGPMSLRSAVLTRAGEAREQRELDDATCSCCPTDMVRWAGRTLLAYRDRSAAEIRDIAIVTRSRSGAWSAPRILSDDGWRIEACPVSGPALAVNRERWLAAWATAPAGVTEIRYTLRDGDAAGATRLLDAGPVQGRVDVQPWATQGFLVAWIGPGAGEPGLQLAAIGARGEVRWRQLVHPTSAGRIAGFPGMASLGDRALLAWPAAGADRSSGTLALRLLRMPDSTRAAGGHP